MNDFRRNLIWGIGMAPFFIGLFFTNYFLVWLLVGLYILFMALYFTVLCIFNDFKKVNGKLRRTFGRIGCFFIGVGIMIFSVVFWFTSFLDIGAYFSNDYKTVKGVSSHHVTAPNLFETFMVDDIKLKSVYKIPDRDLGKVVEAIYLPRSKYVIKLMVYK